MIMCDSCVHQNICKHEVDYRILLNDMNNYGDIKEPFIVKIECRHYSRPYVPPTTVPLTRGTPFEDREYPYVTYGDSTSVIDCSISVNKLEK